MTAFKKDNFQYHGGYLHYVIEGIDGKFAERKFIARFKYASTSSKGPWITFMIKNFTVEEYLERLSNGESPLAIMQSKGFVQSHIKKLLKNKGYPITLAGFDQMISDQIAERKAKRLFVNS